MEMRRQPGEELREQSVEHTVGERRRLGRSEVVLSPVWRQIFLRTVRFERLHPFTRGRRELPVVVWQPGHTRFHVQPKVEHEPQVQHEQSQGDPKIPATARELRRRSPTGTDSRLGRRRFRLLPDPRPRHTLKI